MVHNSVPKIYHSREEKELNTRYYSLSSWLKGLFAGPVRKVSIDAGLGCPNRPGGTGAGGCIYCNARGSGTGAHLLKTSVVEQLSQGISVLSQRYRVNMFIAYFQSYSNTYGSPLLLERLYREALSIPGVVGIAVGTRPDCVEDRTIDVLSELKRDRLVWVELGLQSMHKKTLRLINRGHDYMAFARTAERLMKKGIHVVAHLILGLPGESRSDMLLTARTVSELGVDGIKLHPLYVVRGTPLEDLYRRGLYAPMTMEQSVNLTLDAVSFISSRVVIHRLTSDPHREELVAPKWMLEKRAVRQLLEQTMELTDFRQGWRL